MNAKPVTKKPKTDSIGKLKKKLDAIFSKWVRLRDSDGTGGECISCGNYIIIEEAQNGHFISRRHLATRWHELNGNLQCFACNVWRRGNHPFYQKRLEQKIGKEAVDELIDLAKTTKQFKRSDILEMIDYYTEEFKKLTDLKNG